MKTFMHALVAAFLCLFAFTAAAQAQTQPAFRPYALALDGGTKTAAATAGAATLNKNAGVVTTESVSTAAGGVYTLTLTNSTIAVGDQVFASVQLGTATTGLPEVATVTPGAGSVAIVIHNDHASAAFNGTLKIAFFVLKQ